jgi:hemerythrin superfamily protein
MKKLLGILFLLAISLPALAQSGLSQRDQQRFDSYYTRWMQYRQVNDHGQIISMERRMLDVYAHYGIPSQTPFWRIATNGVDEARHEERPRWRERLSDHDRARFDSLFARWREAREHRDYDDAARLQHHMREIMERNQIPHEVRFEEVASRRDRD